MSRRAILATVGIALTAAGALVLAALMTGHMETPQPYVVQRGDTLFVIARAHGVTVDELRAWNRIEGDLIEVGQVLWTWGPGLEPAASSPERPVAVGALSGRATVDRGLERPRPKRCMAGPTEVEEDDGMAASQGLSQGQAAMALDGFVHHVLPCLAGEGAQPAETLRLEITVACSGVVDGVEVLDAGDWPSSVAACVTDTLQFAEFPAHGLPDGDRFEYPLRFTPG